MICEACALQRGQETTFFDEQINVRGQRDVMFL